MTFNGTTLTVTGDAVVTGKLTAQEFYTEFVSASILFESGSTKFGDSIDDTHKITGSLSITGSLQIPRAASAPAAILGGIYYNTGDNNIYRSNGSTWSSAAGSSGTSGTSGTSGANGSSGTSGTSGANGSSGTSGTSGANGSSGTSGASGSSGTSGANGSSGTSGTSGANGSSGTSGASGSSGTSGASGSSGTSGASGSSGTSGASGSSGTSGASGSSGTSGTGFNTINNASGSRLIISDGTTNAATASVNLTFAGNVLTISSSTATANAPIRNLSLINNTTGTPTASLGVGIEFESETTTTENTTIGFLDYVWSNNTNGSEWGQTELTVKRGGTNTRSHMFSSGVIGSFNSSAQIAAHPQLGDFAGSFPDYKVYASGSTSDGVTKALTFGLQDPTGLTVPNDTTWMFTSYIVARRTDADNESAAYWVQGCVDNNAGTVALVGAVQVTAVEDTVAWNATAVALGGRLQLRVTGEAAKTIYWNAVTHIVQVSG